MLSLLTCVAFVCSARNYNMTFTPKTAHHVDPWFNVSTCFGGFFMNNSTPTPAFNASTLHPCLRYPWLDRRCGKLETSTTAMCRSRCVTMTGNEQCIVPMDLTLNSPRVGTRTLGFTSSEDVRTCVSSRPGKTESHGCS